MEQLIQIVLARGELIFYFAVFTSVVLLTVALANMKPAATEAAIWYLNGVLARASQRIKNPVRQAINPAKWWGTQRAMFAHAVTCSFHHSMVPTNRFEPSSMTTTGRMSSPVTQRSAIPIRPARC